HRASNPPELRHRYLHPCTCPCAIVDTPRYSSAERGLSERRHKWKISSQVLPRLRANLRSRHRPGQGGRRDITVVVAAVHRPSRATYGTPELGWVRWP